MTGDDADFIKLGDDVENGTKRVLPSSAQSNVGVEVEFVAVPLLSGGIPTAGRTTCNNNNNLS